MMPMSWMSCSGQKSSTFLTYLHRFYWFVEESMQIKNELGCIHKLAKVSQNLCVWIHTVFMVLHCLLDAFLITVLPFFFFYIMATGSLVPQKHLQITMCVWLYHICLLTQTVWLKFQCGGFSWCFVYIEYGPAYRNCITCLDNKFSNCTIWYVLFYSLLWVPLTSADHLKSFMLPFIK